MSNTTCHKKNIAIISLVAFFALAFNINSYISSSGIDTELLFNEGSGTTTADGSGNNHTGTLVNGPLWVTGKYSRGISFDGTNDYVSIADQSNYTLLFQPVFPFSLTPPSEGAKANLFIRPGIPLLVDQPVFDLQEFDFDGVTALGDIGFDIGYGATEKSGFLWAFGMVGTLPTATDSDVAGRQLRLGPEVLIAKFEKWGVWGFFPSHQWDVSGWGDGYYSTSQLQLFLKFLPGGGWSYGSAPIMNYDWKSEEWTVPLNFAVSKTVMFGKMPVKLELEANYYIEQPDLFGPEWMIGFNITPVVPNIFDRWIKGM